MQLRGSIAPPAVRWFTKRCSTTTTGSPRASSMSPPLTVQVWVLFVPNCSHTSGEPSSSAFSGSTTTGFGSYSTITCSAASTTPYLPVPTTTATASPTHLTSPVWSGQQPGSLISTPGGSHTVVSGLEKSPRSSSPVYTATTPGCCSAPDLSIETIAACASGERTIAA